uniref:Uncharacterized protein n=1 Tax=Arundo donax TaxID=35708 RepID=A0A0A9FLU0_ARUDO
MRQTKDTEGLKKGDYMIKRLVHQVEAEICSQSESSPWPRNMHLRIVRSELALLMRTCK